MPTAIDASRESVRQSLTRFYPKRTDHTRTRAARRAARARRLALQMKHSPPQLVMPYTTGAYDIMRTVDFDF